MPENAQMLLRLRQHPLTRAVVRALPGAALMAGLAVSSVALAATFTVTNTADSGSGSLRDALTQANGTPGVDTVTFATGVSGTIALSTGALPITEGVTVQGPGPAALAIDGGGVGQVFKMTGTHTSPLQSVTLSGLEIRNGVGATGGGIMANGVDLTLRNCVVSGNRATTSGGGVWVYGGGSNGPVAHVVVDGCTIIGNSVQPAAGTNVHVGGGALVMFGTLTVKQSVISGNLVAGGIGAGLAVTNNGDHDKYGNTLPNPDTLVVTESRITDNTVATAASSYQVMGAGFVVESPGSVTITGSTIADNTIQPQASASAILGGGGVIVNNTAPGTGAPPPGVVTISGSTFSGNTLPGLPAAAASTGMSGGAGIAILDMDGAISNSTISGNTAGTHGGGVLWSTPKYSTARGVSVIANSTIAGNQAGVAAGGVAGLISGNTQFAPSIVNTAISGNTAPGNPDIVTLAAQNQPHGSDRFAVSYSLIENMDPLSITDQGGNIFGQPALLGALASNGGTTLTMLPQPGSPLLDAGDPAFHGPPDTDQRGNGFPRISNSRVDIGAVELYSDVIFQDGFDVVRDLIFRNGFD